MVKGKRNCLDKLNTLLFGKDLRVTEGEPYTEVREYDFSSYFPIENYIVERSLPTENVFDIRDFGADVNNEDNAEYINSAVDKASKCNGTVLSDVVVKNIITDRCSCPIFIRLGNRNRASKVNSANSNIIEFGGRAPKGSISDKSEFDMKSQLNDVVIENVKSTGVELPVIIAGFKQRGRIKRVKNVTLKNIDIDYADIPETVDKRLFIPEYADVYPECWRFRNLPAYALWIRHAENVKIENFNCNHPQPTWKKDVIKEDLI